MKALKKFEKIIETVRDRIQKEVTSLIGEDLSVDLEPGKIVDKNTVFSEIPGKVVLAVMDITGEISGRGALIVSVKDAIRLGGTLIMLPPAELEDVVSSEQYEGETEDSYGEIANIIAGSYTKVFEETYPKACRFVRKEQVVIVPLKIDEQSDEPIVNQLYYQVVMNMQLGQHQMGNLQMLIPAESFGLVGEKTEAETEGGQEIPPRQSPSVSQQSQSSADAASVATKQPSPAAEHPSVDVGSGPKEKPQDIEKTKKRIDSLLSICRERIADEVGALLGVAVECGVPENKPITKEAFFFEEANGKQVCAHIEVTGDADDKSFLFVGLKDAIRIGGTLIMLPPSELETAVAEEDFGDDSQDAYGEIANIIAGVYTAIFEEQFSKSLRFIRREISQVVPIKVDIPSDTPIPDQLYYLSGMQLSISGIEYGRLQMLFPAALLGLELKLEGTQPESAAPQAGAQARPASETAVRESAGSERSGESAVSNADVLIISDSDSDALMISKALDESGLSYHRLSFKDSLKHYLPGGYRAVFLVMKKVDEHGVGMAIKINANCSLPIIAAGPEWTRSKVIRAVKYGVTDIIMTPAEHEDIAEAIRNNVISMAA